MLWFWRIWAMIVTVGYLLTEFGWMNPPASSTEVGRYTSLTVAMLIFVIDGVREDIVARLKDR